MDLQKYLVIGFLMLALVTMDPAVAQERMWANPNTPQLKKHCPRS